VTARVAHHLHDVLDGSGQQYRDRPFVHDVPKVVLGGVQVGGVDEQRAVQMGQRIAVAIGCVLGGCRQPGAPPNVETDDDAGRGDPAESRVEKLTSR